MPGPVSATSIAQRRRGASGAQRDRAARRRVAHARCRAARRARGAAARHRARPAISPARSTRTATCGWRWSAAQAARNAAQINIGFGKRLATLRHRQQFADQPVEPGDLRQDGLQRGARGGRRRRPARFPRAAAWPRSGCGSRAPPRRRPGRARPAARPARRGRPAPRSGACASASRAPAALSAATMRSSSALAGRRQAAAAAPASCRPAPPRCAATWRAQASSSQVSSAGDAEHQRQQHADARLQIGPSRRPRRRRAWCQAASPGNGPRSGQAVQQQRPGPAP